MRCAQKALADAFDDDFLHDETFASHPLGLEWLMRYGRYGVFRLGVALARFGISRETLTRLRDPKQYRACVAELDFGLFLARTGAAITHEPLAPARGPDFEFRSSLGMCGFEVKSPAASRSFAARSNAAREFACELQRQAPQVSGKRGWEIEPRVDAALWPQLMDARLLVDALQAILSALKSWAARPREGVLRVQPGIEVSVVPREQAGVQVWGPAYSGDPEIEVSRFINMHAARSAQQLGALRAPGFVVFSQEQSGQVAQYAKKLIRGLRADTDCSKHIVGIIDYDLRVHDTRLVPVAHVYLRLEAVRMLPLIETWNRAGRVSVAVH